MKKYLGCTTAAAALACGIFFFTGNDQAAAQAGARPAPGTPPIGKMVEISLTAWSYGQAQPTEKKVQGYLVTMTESWVVVQDGGYDVWVPKDHVVVMRANR